MKITKGKRMVLAGIFILMSWLTRENIKLSSLLMLGSGLISATPIVKNALVGLKYRIASIDLLVSIAFIGAVIIGEYWEAAAVTFLFNFGSYLEGKTMEKTRSSIKELLDMAPKKSVVIRNGEEIEIHSDQVLIGDKLIVKIGEKISVDGRVVGGEAYVNQSTITGESMPISKELEDQVYSGTMVESGHLIIRAEKVGEDTSFAKIMKIVEDAQDKKARTQKSLDEFSRYYTPGIILLSLGFYLLTRDLVLSLTLLVIACPGALVISTPVSMIAGIGNAARNGVLIKGGEVIEDTSKAGIIAFDKTGTLTEGRPEVVGFKVFNSDEDRILKLLGIGETYSEHPLGKSIVNFAEGKLGIIKERPERSDIIPGQGLSFTHQSEEYFIGNQRLLDGRKVGLAESEKTYILDEESKGRTVIRIGDRDRLLGVVSLADKIREESKDIINDLRSTGIEKIVMLTGDNEQVAKEVANQLGIEDYYFELLPQDKVEKLNELKKDGKVIMVGDGVNDAPALAVSNVGIAMGGVGSDVAMETADIVLVSDDLNKLNHSINLSKTTMRNVKQNIYFAVTVALLLIIGVLAKKVFLSSGMLIHEISVLAVIMNAMRIILYKNKEV